MTDESVDIDELEWEMAHQTKTAWSLRVAPPRVKGRRTYSRRQSTGALNYTSSPDGPSQGSPSSISQEEKAFKYSDVHKETEPMLSLRPPPAIPPRHKFTRTNSMSAVSNQGTSKSAFQRSYSVDTNHGSLRPTRTRSMRSLSESFNDAENVRPNINAFLISPKRGAGSDANESAKKKVRSARYFGKKGLSTSLHSSSSFSNLSRSCDPPLWGSLPESRAETSPFPPPKRIRDSLSTNESDPSSSNFSESPSESSLIGSSSMKRLSLPWEDCPDETSVDAPLSTRSNFSLTTPKFADEKPRHTRGRRGREPKKNTFEDSDDGISGDDDSVSGNSDNDENMLISPALPTFVPFSQKKNRTFATTPGPRIANSISVEDVIKSMTSYEDLKFIVNELRKESKGNCPSWYVAPHNKWEQTRRVPFLKWIKQSLGFVLRVAGNQVSIAQISKTKGKERLKILEEVLKNHKGKCRTALTPGNPKTDLMAHLSFVESTPAHRGHRVELPSLRSASTPMIQCAQTPTISDELMEGLSSMNLEDRTPATFKQTCAKGSTPATFKLEKGLCLDIADTDNLSVGEPVRPSMENHASARDLMSHMGMTPEIRKGRRRLNRPPRLSLQSVGSLASCGAASKMTIASPFPPMSICATMGSQMKNTPMEFVATPMMQSVGQGWGSCPIQGRDWGTSDPSDQAVTEKLMRKLEQSRADAGFCDEDELDDSPASIGLEFDAVSNYRDPPTAESPECSSPSERDCILENVLSQESPSQSSSTYETQVFFDEVSKNRHNRRRQTSLAKHKRMSLIASATYPAVSMQTNRKSLFVRRPHRSTLLIEPISERIPAVPAFPLPLETGVVETDTVASPPNACDTAMKDEDILNSVLGYLNEFELMCTASLVCSKWADASAHAHADLMMLSIGCTDHGGELEEGDSLGGELPEEKQACVVSGIAERAWPSLVDNYPWACFLSEGAYKKVYKVYNYTHKTEEAVSVMDVDLIESTGNINVVAAELAVSVMLSSLVRRGVCPNFISTRGVFSCPFEPSKQHWGSASNKRPLGNEYCSPRPRKPKQPGRNKRGRYQYIRMELCDEGDAEEFLKNQIDESIEANEARILLFQISFALHAAALKCSLKHYDVKLLNIFLQRVKTGSEKSGDVVLRYGLGSHTFALRSSRERAIFAKLADYGTANIDSGSNGKQVTIAQFTTLENTPPDFLILGDSACQGHGHDSFGLGLCMLHLFTGSAPYEEILSDVTCPPQLKKRLQEIWENEDEAGYSVVRSVILADVYKDEEGHILEGEPDDTLYDTLYKFLVLFGIQTVSPAFESSKVWVAVKESLENNAKGNGSRNSRKKTRNGDIVRYRKDCRKYSLSHGNNRCISRARESLEKMVGGMDLLQSLVCFDPQHRASALGVLNSSFMVALREKGNQVSYKDDDEVLSYTALSTHY